MTPDAMMQKETMPKDTMMKDDKMMATGAMMQKEAPKMDRAMQSHGYMDYSPELVASALKDGQRVVLFFAASWCPSCKALDRAITADLGSI
jgi:thiol-disulfide isomerase/thioredoxin